MEKLEKFKKDIELIVSRASDSLRIEIPKISYQDNSYIRLALRKLLKQP